MGYDVVAEARDRRNSSSVAFARLMDIRAAFPSIRVAAIEGREDVGVWAVWVARVGNFGELELLPCGGKGRVLELKSLLRRSRRVSASGIVFIVDRDYDDLPEVELDEQTFMTDRYSIENYFVSERVVDHVLNTCFSCAGSTAQKKDIIREFFLAFNRYRIASAELQAVTYFIRRTKVQTGCSLPKRLRDIVCIGQGFLFSQLQGGALPVKLPADHDPQRYEELAAEFEALPFLERARGKYHRAFMLYFFQQLQEEQAASARRLFASDKSERDFQFSALNLVEYAGVSEIPVGFADFLVRNLS